MRVGFSVLVAAILSGCSATIILQSEPITISPKPTEILLSPPLRTQTQTNKGIWAVVDAKQPEDLPLRVPPDWNKPRNEQRLHYRDGRVVRAQAVLTLKDGKTLNANGVAGGCDNLQQPCYVFFPIESYDELLIERISLTASAPIPVRRIEWSEGHPK